MRARPGAEADGTAASWRAARTLVRVALGCIGALVLVAGAALIVYLLVELAVAVVAAAA